MRSDWDAIVVGASFAGLAAAMELALAAYRRLVEARRPYYGLLRLLQRGILGTPRWFLPALVWLLADGPLSLPAQSAYWWIADPDTLRPGKVRRDVRGSPIRRFAEVA